MSSELVLAHILLPSAIAAAAGFGAWRCWRLLRYARDPRLLKLMWFYGLFAASLISIAIWTVGLAAAVGDSIDIFLLAHHALMLASLGVAVQAFGHKLKEGAAVAAAGLAFLEPFILVVLASEAAMTLYLAVQAILNQMKRRSPGARQVAAGFLLIFIGHLSFFLFHDPGGVGTLLGDMFALVGFVLLVRLLPRPST